MVIIIIIIHDVEANDVEISRVSSLAVARVESYLYRWT